MEITDRPDDKKYAIIVESPDVPSIYNGQEQSYTVIAGVDTPQSVNGVQSAIEFILSKIKDFFTITAGAEDGDVEFTVSEEGQNVQYVFHNAKVTAKGTDAGDYKFDFVDTPYITQTVDGEDVDVTKQFQTITNDGLGYLKIDKATITITVNNASKVQGTTDPELSGTVEGVLGEDEVTVAYVRETGEDVGVPYAITTTMTKEEFEAEYTNYYFNITPGTFTITAPTPGPTPPTPTPDPTPTTPVTIPDAPAPTAPAPAQAVLGARREEPTSGQAVLGARRARTEDTTNEAARVFAIILAAATAVTLLLTRKKKKEEEEG